MDDHDRVIHAAVHAAFPSRCRCSSPTGTIVTRRRCPYAEEVGGPPDGRVSFHAGPSDRHRRPRPGSLPTHRVLKQVSPSAVARRCRRSRDAGAIRGAWPPALHRQSGFQVLPEGEMALGSAQPGDRQHPRQAKPRGISDVTPATPPRRCAGWTKERVSGRFFLPTRPT